MNEKESDADLQTWIRELRRTRLGTPQWLAAVDALLRALVEREGSDAPPPGTSED